MSSGKYAGHCCRRPCNPALQSVSFRLRAAFDRRGSTWCSFCIFRPKEQSTESCRSNCSPLARDAGVSPGTSLGIQDLGPHPDHCGRIRKVAWLREGCIHIKVLFPSRHYGGLRYTWKSNQFYLERRHCESGKSSLWSLQSRELVRKVCPREYPRL